MRYATAIPLPFTPDSRSRSAYLLAEAFAASGRGGVAVRLPSPVRDPGGLVIEAPLDRMADPSFWRSLGVDRVFLTTWGDPRYEAIPRAIERAAIPYMEYLDTDGRISPAAGASGFLYLSYLKYLDGGYGRAGAALRALAKTALHTLPSAHDVPRLDLLARANMLAVPCETVADRLRYWFRVRERVDLLDRLRIVPHAVSPAFLNGDDKPEGRRVAAVARWNAPVKDGTFCVRVLTAFLAERPAYEAFIVGPTTPALLDEAVRAPSAVRSRLHLTGRLDNPEVAGLLASSRITFVSSRHEAGPLVALETVCSGGSVVCWSDIPVPAELARDGAGRVFHRRTVTAATRALLDEADSWERGERQAAGLSAFGGRTFAAPAVADLVDRLFDGLSTTR